MQRYLFGTTVEMRKQVTPITMEVTQLTDCAPLTLYSALNLLHLEFISPQWKKKVKE